MVMNDIYRGRKINEIAKAGLEGSEDKILLFREMLNSFPADEWRDAGEDEMFDLLRLLDSQTDHLIKGNSLKILSKEQIQEEKRVLDFYKDDISELFTYFSKVDF